MVPSGIDIRVTANVNLNDATDPLCAMVRINIGGRLQFSNGAKIRLAAGACVNVEDGGQIVPSAKGGGASESIEIDHVKYWQASDGVYNGAGTMGSCGIALPVELTNLSAELNGRNLVVSWEVASANDVIKYVLEISIDGSNWNYLTETASIGDHTNAYTYQVNEVYQASGAYNYIKLYSVDLNGSRELIGSAALSAGEDFNKNELLIYPNPASSSGQTKVVFEVEQEEQAQVSLMNQLGQVVKQLHVEVVRGENQFNIELSEIQTGNYVIVVKTGEKTVTNKLVIL